MTICITGLGVKKDFSCFITNGATDVQLIANGQYFPIFWYELSERSLDSRQTTLFDSPSSKPLRHDGISDFAQTTASKQYCRDISKEDIFYYIYGYLHSPKYRKTFSDDLKLSLPRIGFVDSYDDFKDFSDAGKKLADLHLNYESVPMYEGVKILGSRSIEELLADPEKLRVRKMKLDEKSRILVYNEYVTIADIPEDAFRYIVNGRSALGWLVDQYQISVDKESGIENDPNEYGGPEYIFKLVLSVITVSVETMKIVDNLPKLHFDSEDAQ